MDRDSSCKKIFKKPSSKKYSNNNISPITAVRKIKIIV